MIYDCFTFFNELELLELRLHELSAVVDRFVLVEATRTHSNQPKPLYFEENKERFAQFLPKIVHVIVSDFPENPESRWTLENFQRNAIIRGLQDCKPNDVIIISDIDEIVDPRAIREFKNKPGIKIFNQKLYYYFFNCLAPEISWTAAKMVFFKDMKSPQWLREYPKPIGATRRQRSFCKLKNRLRRFTAPPDILIQEGGWHFSYLGGAERIIEKVRSFAHAEFDKSEITDLGNLKNALGNGTDALGRKGIGLEFVQLDSSFPKFLLENLNKYSCMIRHE